MPCYNEEQVLAETSKRLKEKCEMLIHDGKIAKESRIVFVDDGSKDGSGKICDQLAAKDTRVKVIHKTNGGICSARNAGLKMAAGEYIAFCDNDDIYLPELLEDNYALAKNMMQMWCVIQEVIARSKTAK